MNDGCCVAAVYRYRGGRYYTAAFLPPYRTTARDEELPRLHTRVCLLFRASFQFGLRFSPCRTFLEGGRVRRSRVTFCLLCLAVLTTVDAKGDFSRFNFIFLA